MALPVRECLQKVVFSKWISSAVLLGSKKEFDVGRDVASHRKVHATHYLLLSALHDEASLIKTRIPKSISPLGLYVKENFEKKSHDLTNSGLMPKDKKIATILRETVQDFKALPASEMKKYQQQSSATREAYKRALATLTADEKAVLLIDKRKKSLKKRVAQLRKEWNALKRKFEYPGNSPSSFVLFIKHRKRVVLPEAKGVVETTKAASLLWKKLSASEKEIYVAQADQLKSEARLKKAQWRMEMVRTEKASLERMDWLKSEIRKLKLRVAKIDQSPSIEDASRVGLKPKLVQKRKKAKRVVKKKVLAKKVGLKTKGVRKTTTKKVATKRKVTKKAGRK